ncbi:hypothetical protein ACFC1T_09485 [Kitasatospora sp. NPDC056076]|uniref:hypothetical protein n=1 Tax=Kitasatospora sp. NPDC056076 TaxID=3345703 RepID=UPI0035E06EF6
MPSRHLFSFERGRRYDPAEVVERITAAAGGVRPDMILDSGAFSAMTIGARSDVDEYAAWLRSWQPWATAAFTLDSIGDPKASAANHARLLAKDTGVPLIPVFHANSPLEYLHRMCERERYVAFGGLVSLKHRRHEIGTWLSFHTQIAGRYGTRVHALGVTSGATAAVPLYSCDSSAVTACVRYGRLWLWDSHRAQIVQPKYRSAAERQQVARLLPRHGVSMADLADPHFMDPMSTERSWIEDRNRVMEAGGRARALLEDYLIRRHRVSAPPGLARGRDTGTKVYAAFTDIDQHETAARAWAALQPRKEGTPT